MSLRTSSSPSGTSTTGYKKDIYFGQAGSESISKPITVTTAPIHIIVPNLPPGCLIGVERLYNVIEGKCDPSVPPATVYCEDGCSPLYLFNEADPDCPGGRRIQNEIWLWETGNYQLVMEGECDPETVIVWGIEDPLVRDIPACNLPIRGQLCLPDCVIQHVGLFTGESPDSPPDCMRCEDPIRINLDTGCTAYWVAPVGSNCQEGEDNGHWEVICPPDPEPHNTVVAGNNITIDYGTNPEGGIEATINAVLPDPVDPCEGCCDDPLIEDIPFGGGVCVALSTLNSGTIYQSRDNNVIAGTAVIDDVSTVGPLSYVVTNNTACRQCYDVAVTCHASFEEETDIIGKDGMVFVFSDVLLEPFPDFDDLRFGQTNLRKYVSLGNPDNELFPYPATSEYNNTASGATTLKFCLEAGQSKTLYGQWWYKMADYTGPQPVQVVHGDMGFTID